MNGIWICTVSLKYLIVLYSSFLWWCEMIKIPLWWGFRPCDIVYVTIDLQKEDHLLPGDPEWAMRCQRLHVRSRWFECWGSEVGWSRMVWDFITLLRTVSNDPQPFWFWGLVSGRQFVHGPGMGGWFSKWHLCTSFLLLLLHQFPQMSGIRSTGDRAI